MAVASHLYAVSEPALICPGTEGGVMKWLAIVNPTAHNGVGLCHLQAIARMLHKELGARCAWTEYPRHARDIAWKSQEYDGFIAVGGDGTIYQVVNGMDLRTQCLGIVPAGTGNGLARELGVLNFHSGLKHLRQPQLAPLDLILARYRSGPCWQQRYVVHHAAVGYVAEVVALALGPLKPLGYLRYAAAAGVQCCRRKQFRARVQIDDGVEQEFFLTNLAINNTRHAGSFCLFPEASLQDGRLDLMYGRNLPHQQLLEDLGILTQMYFAQHSQRCQAKSVSAELDPPLTLTIDGELIPQVDAVQFKVVPGCLRCVAGTESGLKLLDEEPALSSSPEEPATDGNLARC
jgi:diacylglycerol kinase family enzyme